MHAIDIGISGHDDLIVSEALHSLLDVEGGLQQVKFLVLIDHLLGEPVAVERLATEGEDGLRVDIAALGDGAAGRIALSDENA